MLRLKPQWQRPEHDECPLWDYRTAFFFLVSSPTRTWLHRLKRHQEGVYQEIWGCSQKWSERHKKSKTVDFTLGRRGRKIFHIHACRYPATRALQSAAWRGLTLSTHIPGGERQTSWTWWVRERKRKKNRKQIWVLIKPRGFSENHISAAWHRARETRELKRTYETRLLCHGHGPLSPVSTSEFEQLTANSDGRWEKKPINPNRVLNCSALFKC